jgi:hypothetical protein
MFSCHSKIVRPYRAFWTTTPLTMDAVDKNVLRLQQDRRVRVRHLHRAIMSSRFESEILEKRIRTLDIWERLCPIRRQ